MTDPQNLPEETTSQTPGDQPSTTESSDSGAGVPSTGEAPAETGRPDSAQRRIRIGSQRDTTPRSPVYRTPPGSRPSGTISTAPLAGTTPAAGQTTGEPQAENRPEGSTAGPEQAAEQAQAAGQAEESASAANSPSSAPAEPTASGEGGELRSFRSDDLEAAPDTGDAPAPRRGAVPVPSKRNVPAELEAEVEAALGGMAIDDLLAVSPAAAVESEALELEATVNARVLHLEGDNIFFALGGRNQGVASVRQFVEPPEPGVMLEVIIGSFNAEDGLYEVTVPGASIDVRDWADLHEGAVVEARVTGHNTGGLECEVNALQGFIPISQVSLYRVDDLSQFVGEKFACVVVEANPERRNLVLSRRAMLEREREAQRAEKLAALEPGQLVEGVVRSIREFGVFVDLGGIDGLIHISQLSWDRVEDASTVLREGEKVKVKVQKIDPATGKISLSYRATQESPWARVAEKYPVGSLVRGPVSRIAKFGAFVKLEPGVEGLIHISELAHHRVSRVDTIVREGQEVEAKVMSVDAEAQRIGLSLKATLEAPVDPQARKAAEPEEVERELAVKPRSGPLKGGRDRSSGGDQFGLNW